MTRDEILNMPAGKKIDELIAKKIMKTTLFGFRPSTGITSTLMIIDEMEGTITRFTTHKYNDGYGVFLNSDFEVRAKTLPLAICRAALLATYDTTSTQT